MNARNPFTTIKIEGGLLSSDYLHQIATGDGHVPGLSPSSYHLAPGERLSDAISGAWNVMRGRWVAFKDGVNHLPARDNGVRITRDRFLLPLFDELGYGRLLAAKENTINGIDYPISHGWGHCPIHLMGWNVPNDSRTVGVAGASQTNPHSLLQRFLNISENTLWGFLSNGHLLRVLRDNKTFARQSFIEFDLEAMFDGENYADFAIFFLLCHESRVEADKPHECYLEQWVQAVGRSGTRALEQLRFGVEEAIKEIGQGFLEESANSTLLDRLRNGSLSSAEYFRQILRLIYRMLFLFTAEDRGLLHPPQTDQLTRKRYRKYYSLGRVRELAATITGTRHGDLWECLGLVFRGLNGGMLELGLPGLNSFLWSESATEGLNGARLSDKRLLSVIRNLAYIKDRNTRTRVDYSNLGSEELGGIYENILELTPSLNVAAGVITFETTSISERSETNSHYTPSSLVECLCDSALEPVIEHALNALDPERALLDIKVCDPACGSGHFLVAAARRIAKRLAWLRSGELEPSPNDRQRALRDVVGRCVYGVDLNPMAVELCKISLWFETIEPGKPLSFLDHKIKHGNSLIGATPSFIAQGIPDAAFTALEGDDKQFVLALKKANKQAREETNLLLFTGEIVWEAFARIKDGMVQIEGLGNENLGDIQQKQKEYDALLVGDDYSHQKLVADAWCAAFTCKKTKAEGPVLTQEEFNLIGDNPKACAAELREKIRSESDKYSFFHWHLEFPEIFSPNNESGNGLCGWNGGFDVVLGNPPWDKVNLMEKEWFSSRAPWIAKAASAAIRKRLIVALEREDPKLFGQYQEAFRKSLVDAFCLRSSGRYPLCGRGNVNTYTVFTELSRTLLNERGFAGLVIPTGIATDDTTKFFIQDVIDKKSLVSLFDFENKEIFPSVDSRFKFCLFTVGSGVQPVTEKAQFVFFAHDVQDIQAVEKRFTLGADEIALLNPNTRTCTSFRSPSDAELNKAVYRRVPIFIREGETRINPWGASSGEMFHMSHDSSLFQTDEALRSDGFACTGNVFSRGSRSYLPLIEAKMLHHYDHRWSTFSGEGESRAVTSVEKLDPTFTVVPRYWVEEREVRSRFASSWSKSWFIAFRNITNATNERSAIATILPLTGLGHSASPIFVADKYSLVSSLLLSNLSSFILDFAARSKIGGTNLNFFILQQLPILVPEVYEQECKWSGGSQKLKEWVLSRALELIYTALDLKPFAEDCGYAGPPFPWDEQRRFVLRCELDAAFFHLYLGTPDDWESQPQALRTLFPALRNAVAYVMNSFPIVRKKDEQQFGRYRTKEAILEIYDAMAEAERTGQKFESNFALPSGESRGGQAGMEEGQNIRETGRPTCTLRSSRMPNERIQQKPMDVKSGGEESQNKPAAIPSPVNTPKAPESLVDKKIQEFLQTGHEIERSNLSITLGPISWKNRQQHTADIDGLFGPIAKALGERKIARPRLVYGDLDWESRMMRQGGPQNLGFMTMPVLGIIHLQLNREVFLEIVVNVLEPIILEWLDAEPKKRVYLEVNSKRLGQFKR
jgi:hypothetical protein